MKRFWKKIGAEKDFSVISISDDIIRGARFHLRSKKWHLTSFYAAETTDDSRNEKLREVVRKIGSSDYCAVTGKVPEGVFFRFNSTDMPEKSQRGAVEFELLRQVIRVPEKSVFQFTTDPIAGAEDAVGVNVTLYPQQSIDEISALLTGSGCTADEFIFPFMAVADTMPQLYLPEIESEFYFNNGKWMPVPSDPAELEVLTDRAVSAVQKRFVLPEDDDFPVREYLPVLMTAGVIAANGVSAVSSSLRVLPEKVRPVRYRQHVVLAALLVVLLLVNLGWKFYRTHGKTIREYRKSVVSVKQLKAKTAKMKTTIKRETKDNKEIARVVEMNSGNRVVVPEFALISDILPKDVMVSSIRWNDEAIDMVLICENDKIDLPRLLQPLYRWQVAQLQQRQAGDSAVATINLKLVPLKAKDGEK